MDALLTDELRAVLGRAEELANDLGLQAVRRWKARTGGKALGYLPIWAPRELLEGAGVLAVGIVGGGDAVEIVRGDAYFQSYICQIPRSTIELGLNGSLDALDGMIFPSTCDVIRNLSGMWQLLFPDRYVRYLDLPQNFDPALGGSFFEGELRGLWADLQRLTAKPASEADLWAAIEAGDRNRRAIADVYALRAAQPWLVPTGELFLVLKAGNVLPLDEHTALLREYERAARASGRPVEDRARVAMTGCFCEQPPLGLITTLERSGCYVVADDFARAARFLQGDVAPAPGLRRGDPIAALSRAVLGQSVKCASMYLESGVKGQALLDEARGVQAEGVIFAAPSFCDPALLDQPMTQKAVEAAGVPTTAFKYAENNGQFQAIREQTGAFADSIKIWSEVAPAPRGPIGLPVVNASGACP